MRSRLYCPLAVAAALAACAEGRPAVTIVAPPRHDPPPTATPERLAPPPAGANQRARGYRGHGAESVPPEVIAKYAPPPLPAELSRKIQAMLDVRAPGAGLLAPDGKRFFFTWSVTGVTQVWRLDG